MKIRQVVIGHVSRRPMTQGRALSAAPVGLGNGGHYRQRSETARTPLDEFGFHVCSPIRLAPTTTAQSAVRTRTSPWRSTLPVGSMGSSFSARRRTTVGTLNVDRLRRAGGTRGSNANPAPRAGQAG